MLSPKYEGSDLKQELLCQALKQSFLEGEVGPSDYARGKADEGKATLFTSLKARFNSTMRGGRGNPYANYKVQMRAKKMFKSKLRIYNLSVQSQYAAVGETKSSRNRSTFGRFTSKTPIQPSADSTLTATNIQSIFA